MLHEYPTSYKYTSYLPDLSDIKLVKAQLDTTNSPNDTDQVLDIVADPPSPQWKISQNLSYVQHNLQHSLRCTILHLLTPILTATCSCLAEYLGFTYRPDKIHWNKKRGNPNTIYILVTG